MECFCDAVTCEDAVWLELLMEVDVIGAFVVPVDSLLNPTPRVTSINRKTKCVINILNGLKDKLKRGEKRPSTTSYHQHQSCMELHNRGPQLQAARASESPDKTKVIMIQVLVLHGHALEVLNLTTRSLYEL